MDDWFRFRVEKVFRVGAPSLISEGNSNREVVNGWWIDEKGWNSSGIGGTHVSDFRITAN